MSDLLMTPTGVLSQLCAWGESQPQTVEPLLDLIRVHRPDLWQDLILAATASGRLNPDEAGRLLNAPEADLTERLLDWRDAQDSSESSVVCGLGLGHAARLAESSVPIWEIVREYRRHPSFEATVQRIPHLSRLDVITALAYARRHSDEIEACIAAYDQHLDRVRRLGDLPSTAVIP